ncbi:hypothetical protein EC973_009087 [Apophysomyces ossiformis]|uniref:SWIRM domain-containing protein n=1 Tax=Apophysomyces ossiformis TaxID=679940 RepID=A0A8H7BST0_9FUNG|nr:hypothetical protein EC973_009087 [Apophysomyces ossiformis]
MQEQTSKKRHGGDHDHDHDEACFSHGNTSSLLSPPLTPTEAKTAPSSASWQPNTTTATVDRLLVVPFSKRNKQFIESYAQMVHFLRPEKHATIHSSEQVFQLDVYEALTSQLRKKDHQQQRRPEIEDGSGSRCRPVCARLNKDVSQQSRKRRRIMSDKTVTDKAKSRVSKSPTTQKKDKTDSAAAFDSIDIDSDDITHYPHAWIPNQAHLDQVPVKVFWKGAPLMIHDLPYFDRLHPVEVTIASTLRLTPVQYLRCKRVLIRAAQQYDLTSTPFRKSDAQKLCRVDVNKTSALWTAFGQLGWLGPNWPN